MSALQRSISISVALLCSTFAQAAPYVLRFSGPSGCPSETQVRAEVASRAHDASKADGVTLELSVAQAAAGVSGVLRLTDETGHQSHRTISAKTCAAVTQALIFLAALAIDLGGHFEEPESPRPSPPAPSPSPSSAIAEPVVELPVVRTSPIELAALASAGVRTGLGPSAQPQADLAFELARVGEAVWPLRLRLSGVFSAGQASNTLGRGEFWLWSSRLELFFLTLGRGALSGQLGLGLELGAVRAVGSIELDPKIATDFWASATATVALRWRFSRALFLELDGGVGLPFTRTRYYFVPEQTLWLVPSLTGRAALSLGAYFSE